MKNKIKYTFQCLVQSLAAPLNSVFTLKVLVFLHLSLMLSPTAFLVQCAKYRMHWIKCYDLLLPSAFSIPQFSFLTQSLYL